MRLIRKRGTADSDERGVGLPLGRNSRAEGPRSTSVGRCRRVPAFARTDHVRPAKPKWAGVAGKPARRGVDAVGFWRRRAPVAGELAHHTAFARTRQELAPSSTDCRPIYVLQPRVSGPHPTATLALHPGGAGLQFGFHVHPPGSLENCGCQYPRERSCPPWHTPFFKSRIPVQLVRVWTSNVPADAL